MNILYESSLLQTLADLLNNRDAKKALQTAYDILNDGAIYTEKVGPVVDQIFANLNYLNKSSNAWVLAQEALIESAGKAAVSAVTGVITSLLTEINSSFPWTSLFTDILNLLTNADEDFAAIKAVYMQTDNLNEEKPEYRNTFSLYNKAVHDWRNAPRMTDSTIFTAYAAVPVSISAYIQESIKDLLSLLVSPEDPAMGPIFKQIQKFYDILVAAGVSMRDNQIRSNPITVRSVTLKRTPGLTVLSSNPDYRYYMQVEMLKGLRIPEDYETVDDDGIRKYGIRFRLFKDTEEDPEGWLRYNTDTDDWVFPAANLTSRVISVDTGFNARKNVFLEDIVSGYSDTEPAEKEEFLTYLKQEDILMYLELVKVDWNEDDEIYEIKIVDVVPIELYKLTEVKDSENSWYSVFSVGSIFPEAADWVKNIETLIEDWLNQLLGFASDARVVLGEFRNMLLGIINKVFAFYKGLFKLIMTVARVLKFMDIRYMVFDGSYTDLVNAWLILRKKFGIIEEGDYMLFNLVASVKSKTTSQLVTESLKRSIQDTKKKADTALQSNAALQRLLTLEASNRRNGRVTPKALDPEVAASVADSELVPILIGQLSATNTEDFTKDFGFVYIPELKTYTDPL